MKLVFTYLIATSVALEQLTMDPTGDHKNAFRGISFYSYGMEDKGHRDVMNPQGLKNTAYKGMQFFPFSLFQSQKEVPISGIPTVAGIPSCAESDCSHGPTQHLPTHDKAWAKEMVKDAFDNKSYREDMAIDDTPVKPPTTTLAPHVKEYIDEKINGGSNVLVGVILLFTFLW